MVFGNNMFLPLKAQSQTLCSNTFSTEIDTKLYNYITVTLSKYVTEVQ